MSIAYQCWEMGVGSRQSHSLPQYHVVSDSSKTTLRCHSSPVHETSFVMYMQQQQQQSDALKPSRFVSSSSTTTTTTTATTISSQAPISATASSPDGDAKPVETNVTTSSVTTEDKAAITMGEAESKQSVPGTPIGIPSGLSMLPGLRVKVTKAKPGVVEHIVPVGAESPYENSSESSSSICQASEDSGSCSSGDTGGEEAQSAYRGPLTTMMSALDESLPIKRPGLSKFFGGKSRSFSSLAEVSTVTELAKPNNPYAKRRKMGFNCPLGDKNRSYPPPTRSSGASIAKKLPSNGSRNTLAVAVILGGLQEEQQERTSAVIVPKPETMRTFPYRSYSLTDLPHAGSPPPLRRSFVRP